MSVHREQSGRLGVHGMSSALRVRFVIGRPGRSSTSSVQNRKTIYLTRTIRELILHDDPNDRMDRQRTVQTYII